METSSSSDIDPPIELISREFNRQLDLQCDDEPSSNLSPDPEEARVDDQEHEDRENVEENDDEDDDDDDFTFMLIGDGESEIHGDKASEDGQIRQVFPLFGRNLLPDGEYDVEEVDRLPIQPPVDKIFIQSRSAFPSENEENAADATAGPYCAWSKESATSTSTATGTATAAAELSKKSNSTGFSRLWRLKDIVGRSNSSGRDAFVFLKSSDRTATAETSTVTASKEVNGDGRVVKVNVDGGKARVVKQGTRGKKAKVSAHEAYLKSRGEYTEEERRRSYLPYRPELMGFFTNVHGGLTKNVHPY